MQNNQYPYPYPHQLLFFDPNSQTYLSCITLPPQAFMLYETSKLQIKNKSNLVPFFID